MKKESIWSTLLIVCTLTLSACNSSTVVTDFLCGDVVIFDSCLYAVTTTPNGTFDFS